MLKLIVQGTGFSQELTGHVEELTWSGSYDQCTRTLEFTLATSPTAPYLQTIKCDLGNQILFYVDDQLLFDGYVFRREKSTEDARLQIICFDRGIYLKRNQGVYAFENQTAAAITQQVCRDYGIKVGNLPNPSTLITRNFLGCSLYEIIQTAYTFASHETKKAYMITFQGDTLTVLEEALHLPLILAGGSNLMRVNVTESIENMVNQVNIYNQEDQFVRSLKREDAIALYGLMQSYLQQNNDEDMENEAQKLLEDHGVEQKITVGNLGNITCVTGQTVMVQEPYTGLFGVFWIENDVHTWKLNQYYNTLTLHFRRMMDEQEAGSSPAN